MAWQASGTVIEVIELGAEAEPGVEPVNVALSVDEPDWFRPRYVQNTNPK